MSENNEELFEIKADSSGKADEKEVPEDADMKKSDFGEAQKPEAEAETSTELVAVPKTEIAQTDQKPEEIAENDDFAEDIEALERDSHDEEIMKNLSESINRQVEIDLVSRSIADGDQPEELIQERSAEEEQEEPTKVQQFLNRFPKWVKISVLVVLIIGIAFLIMACTGLGNKLLIKLGSKYVADKVNYEKVVTLTPDQMVDPATLDNPDEEPVATGIPEITDMPMPSLTPEPTALPTPVPGIKNVLLLGEEAINSGGSRGRTDLIIIATVDTKDKTLKLTSFARDSLVSIPGYSDNRINAAYAIGGLAKLYEVLERNFAITPDNYAKVGFNDFEKIVDAVGGIDIELSKNEAKYLNRTNYISNPAYRNVVEGMNHMNGNQALGYCRVRKVSTKNKESNDFGRTSRQREVLQAVFDKVKTLSYTELLSLANECLPYVTTDMTATQIEEYLSALVSIGGMNIKVEEMRIPVDGYWNYVTLRGMSVTQIDLEYNKKALHSFIYGEE